MSAGRPLHEFTKDGLDRARQLRASGLSWKQVNAAMGGRDWHSAIKRADAAEAELNGLPLAYRRGCIARKQGDIRSSCPHPGLSTDRTWWLAGWNDTDLEMGKL